MKRFLCLYLPSLSIDRTRSPCPPPDKEDANSEGQRAPCVVAAPGSGGLRVIDADAAALQAGVRTGCTLTEARAVCADLTVISDDSAADRAAIEALARWADCLSPVVHIEDRDTLIVDVTGCQRVFGGEDALIEKALTGLQAQGYHARAAVADTVGAAWALAHADGRAAACSQPGRVAAAIMHLPVESLRIESQVTEALRRVGVCTVEALLHLPRASVAARFGDPVLRRLDQALGDEPELLEAYHPPRSVRAVTQLAAATSALDVLREATARSLAIVCDQLARRRAGVRQMFVTFYQEGGAHRTLDVQVSQAVRDPAALRSLMEARIDDLKLAGKVEAVTVWARACEPLDDAQQVWFETDEADYRELAGLLDRLAARLGRGCVVRPQPVDDHQPERAFRCTSVLDGNGLSRSRRPAVVAERAWSYRPLRLLRRPVQVFVRTEMTGGPPLCFVFSGREVRVAGWLGPERVATGWWRGRWIERDYYCIESDTGCHYWLFRRRDETVWFVHGVFD